MKTFHVDRTCPHCATKLPCTTPLHSNYEPSPGDVGVCFSCGGLITIDETGALGKVTAELLNSLESEVKYKLLKAQTVAIGIKLFSPPGGTR